MNNNDIVKKSLFLTSLFADIKSEHTWSTNETKMTLLLFSQLSKYKIYLPDFENITDNLEEFKRIVSKVPLEYSFNKKDFQEITNVDNTHLAREINKVRKKLISKVIHTPHPLYQDDKDSGVSLTWFTRIDYSNKTGEITIKLNPDAMERLVAFVKYSKISFDKIVNIQSNYSIYTYLIIKILIDASKCKKLKMTIVDFKEKIGLSGKYHVTNLFRDKVLDVIKKEINEHTDINFNYELIKGESGKAKKYIELSFDYQSTVIEHKKTKKIVAKKEEPYLLEDVTSDEYIDESSPFEHTLTGWSVRAKKVVEIEDTYSLEVISQSIDETIKAETEGKIKTTKAAFFVGVLANKQKSDDEIFERQLNESRKKEEKAIKASKSAEKEKQYNAIQNDIHLYEEDLSRYLSAKSVGGNVDVSKEAIDFIETVSNVDKEIFKGYKSKFAVLDNGYINVKTGKNIRPNIYDFLCLIHDL